MSDAVISAALQSAPVGGIIIAILVLLLRRESSSNATHEAQRSAWSRERAEWTEERAAYKAEIRSNEKTIDAVLDEKREIEDAFARYRREHP